MTEDRGEPPRVWFHSQWGGMVCWRNYPADRNDGRGGRRRSFSRLLANVVGAEWGHPEKLFDSVMPDTACYLILSTFVDNNLCTGLTSYCVPHAGWISLFVKLGGFCIKSSSLGCCTSSLLHKGIMASSTFFGFKHPLTPWCMLLHTV